MKIACKPDRATGGSRAPLRTLIVDDSDILVICLREFLDQQEQVRVVGTAANGSEAVRKAGELKPDLVLMDVQMPCMDGLQATALLRRRLPGTRIIIMTLDETDHTKAAARAQGAHGFIGKSQLASRLMPEIRRVFRLKRTEPEGAPEKRT